jgi:hypothetical protein
MRKARGSPRSTPKTRIWAAWANGTSLTLGGQDSRSRRDSLARLALQFSQKVTDPAYIGDCLWTYEPPEDMKELALIASGRF